MAAVKYDVVTLPEGEEFGVYARVGDDAALLAVFHTKDGATTFARDQCKSTASYGAHPDGTSGWVAPIPFI